MPLNKSASRRAASSDGSRTWRPGISAGGFPRRTSLFPQPAWPDRRGFAPGREVRGRQQGQHPAGQRGGFAEAAGGAQIARMKHFHECGSIQIVRVNDPAVIFTVAVLHLGADVVERSGHVRLGQRCVGRRFAGAIKIPAASGTALQGLPQTIKLRPAQYAVESATISVEKRRRRRRGIGPGTGV